jgi:hypothetical protein
VVGPSCRLVGDSGQLQTRVWCPGLKTAWNRDSPRVLRSGTSGVRIKGRYAELESSRIQSENDEERSRRDRTIRMGSWGVTGILLYLTEKSDPK